MNRRAGNATSAAADALRWLAGLFAAPLDPDAVRSLRAGAGADQLALLAQIPGLAPGIERMRAALAGLSEGAAGAALLAQRYTLLFSGAGGPDTVPPYESAFTAPGGRLFGEAEGRLRRLLAGRELHVAAGPREPADHIAIELAALAELASSQDPGAGDARRALTAILCGWLGAFAAACAAQDRTGFYAGAAQVATALVGLAPDAADGPSALPPGAMP